MNLIDKENELFGKWKDKLQVDENIFAKDGVADEKLYKDAKYKIIFLAKETNDTGKGWDTREYLKSGMVYKSDKFKKDEAGIEIRNQKGKKIKEHISGKPIAKTFNNIFRWANLFLSDINEFNDYEHVPNSQKERQKIFSLIGMMNLKKTTGKSTTNNKELYMFVHENKEYIQEQLSLYEADIIICCGKGVYNGYKKVFGILEEENKNNGTFKTAKHKKAIIIDFNHPQARKKIKDQYEIMQSIKKQYLL